MGARTRAERCMIGTVIVKDITFSKSAACTIRIHKQEASLQEQEVCKDIRLDNVGDLGGPYEERICSSQCRSREVDCLERMCFLRAIAVQRDHKCRALGEEFHGGELS